MLEQLRNPNLWPASLATSAEAEFGLACTPAGPQLAILSDAVWLASAGFEGKSHAQAEKTLLLGPASPRNAAALRACLPGLRPQMLGLKTSAGLGDRLGLARPKPSSWWKTCVRAESVGRYHTT